MSRPRIEVNLDELDQIIDRGTHAPLSEAEGQKLKTALHATGGEEVICGSRNTEKTSAVASTPNAAGRRSAECGATCARMVTGAMARPRLRGAKRVSISARNSSAWRPVPGMRPGKSLPSERTGDLVRIVGQAPLEATVFEMERLRCNACGQVFTAAEPETAGPDKYDVTAVAMIALLKYGTGVPFKRLERLQQQLGMPLPATTQWELVEKPPRSRSNRCWTELIRQAAQGGVMHNDDTGMRVLRLAREPGDKRTGMFTSGIVSMVGAWTIALYFTGCKHAGENLAEVLKQRARELPAPIQMCDALSRNMPKLEGVETLLANCLAHGRRQFVEVVENFPEECRYVLETLREVYRYRRAGAGTGAVAGRTPALPPGAQRAGDGRTARAGWKRSSRSTRRNRTPGWAKPSLTC